MGGEYGVMLLQVALIFANGLRAARFSTAGIDGNSARSAKRGHIAYGTGGFPFTLAERELRYGSGTCPVVEDLHGRTFVGINLCMNDFSPDDVDLVIAAFRKVWANLGVLKE